MGLIMTDGLTSCFAAFLSLQGIKKCIKVPSEIIDDDLKEKNERTYNLLLHAMNKADSMDIVLSSKSMRFSETPKSATALGCWDR